MRVRWIGLVCALAIVGAALGYAVGREARPVPTAFSSARPVSAASPATPTVPPEPFAPDIGLATLEPGLDYRRVRIGLPGYRWEYAVPRGWVEAPEPFYEVRWRPSAEAVSGGYGLRVKIVNEHLTDAEMVAQKREAVERIYEDVEILEETEDLLSFSYRDPGSDRQRFNTFQWFTPVGGGTAEFEMSVVGRAQDVAGLADLRRRVAESVRRLP